MRNRIVFAVVIAAFGLLASACRIDVERNEDGSLQIEALISEAEMARAIDLGMEEEGDVDVDLKDGYALVTAEGPAEWGDGTDVVTFRLDLFVVDDHLGAEVTDATWNGIEIPEAMVEIWNEALAAELEASAKEDPDSTLVAVEITEDELRFEFQLQTDQSKS